MDSTGSPKKVITLVKWEKKLTDANIRKEEMNTLVMNFLISNELALVADQFSKESGTKHADLALIPAQSIIKQAIKSGDMEKAFNTLVESFGGLPALPLFHVDQQRLIELIRQGNVEAALKFSHECFAVWVQENPNVPEFREELERTMLLLAYDDPSTSPIKELMDRSRLLSLADEVNEAILASQNRRKDSMISCLLNMLTRVQDDLDEHIVYPHINIASGTLEDPLT